ncbi:hypothetical protein K440DRAFT_225754 [Wilcoxina mikolae CBS 423.85]|nr:hypothetical protein K440DRAFT_225754 [Wilcoxina mikolae CBS 423.85]
MPESWPEICTVVVMMVVGTRLVTQRLRLVGFWSLARARGSLYENQGHAAVLAPVLVSTAAASTSTALPPFSATPSPLNHKSVPTPSSSLHFSLLSQIQVSPFLLAQPPSPLSFPASSSLSATSIVLDASSFFSVSFIPFITFFLAPKSPSSLLPSLPSPSALLASSQTRRLLLQLQYGRPHFQP